MKNSLLIKQLQSYIELCSTGLLVGESPFHKTLEEYMDPARWPALDEQLAQLLGEAFLCWGELQLQDQPMTAPPQAFIAAANLLPMDPFVLIRQAVAFVKFSQELGLWELGAALVEQALALLPEEFLAWRLLGQICERLGEREADLLALEAAFAAYTQALAFCDPASEEFRAILWEQGRVCYDMGKLSGEAMDFHRAIELYQRAIQLGESSLTFFIDCGHAYDALGSLLGRQEMLFEALSYYQSAAKIDSTHFEAHLQLACHAQHLFEMYNIEEYYILAHASFETACALYPNDPLVWCKRAMLLAIYGKRSATQEDMTASLTLFAHAHSLDPTHTIVLTRWAEVLLACGAESENYEWLREAEQKMSVAVQLNPAEVEVLAMHGYSLNELGNYFSDESYHHQAVEQFQYALELEPANPRLLYGLALSHLAVACLRGDLEIFQRVADLFQRAADLDQQPSADFLVDWGVALMRFGEISLISAHAQDAVDKFELAIKQHMEQESPGSTSPPIDWLYNYGCALDFLGDFDDEPTHYERAIQVLNCVVEADPTFTNARYNLAIALSHLGELVADVECFNLAAEQFKLLLESDPEDSHAWEEWGGMLLQQALLMHEPARPSHSEELFSAAEQRLSQAVALGASSALYTLACLYSLQGNYEAGMHYIGKAAACGALPPLDDLMHDEWLEGLRSMPHFRRMLLELASKAGSQ